MVEQFAYDRLQDPLTKWFKEGVSTFVIQKGQFLAKQPRPKAVFETKYSIFNYLEYLIVLCMGATQEEEYTIKTITPGDAKPHPLYLCEMAKGGDRIISRAAGDASR